jgi:protein-disulfide isomerase
MAMRVEWTMIGAALALGATMAAAATKPLPTSAKRNWNTTVTVTPQGNHVLGNPAAELKLTEFVSYTCPHCAHFETEADAPLRLTMVMSGKGSIEVRNFVRDPVDLTVALLTNCGPASKFFLNHSTFLRRQGQWIAPLVAPSPSQKTRWYTGPFAQRTRYIAQDFGFYPIMQSRGYTPQQIDVCLANEGLAKRLAAATDEAADKLYVSGTPSFAIDGVVLAGTHSWDALRPQLDARLR